MTLKIIAKRSVTTTSETSTLRASSTTAASLSPPSVVSPKAATAALTTRETRSRNPTARTMASDSSRSLTRSHSTLRAHSHRLSRCDSESSEAARRPSSRRERARRRRTPPRARPSPDCSRGAGPFAPPRCLRPRRGDGSRSRSCLPRWRGRRPTGDGHRHQDQGSEREKGVVRQRRRELHRPVGPVFARQLFQHCHAADIVARPPGWPRRVVSGCIRPQRRHRRAPASCPA